MPDAVKVNECLAMSMNCCLIITYTHVTMLLQPCFPRTPHPGVTKLPAASQHPVPQLIGRLSQRWTALQTSTRAIQFSPVQYAQPLLLVSALPSVTSLVLVRDELAYDKCVACESSSLICKRLRSCMSCLANDGRWQTTIRSQDSMVPCFWQWSQSLLAQIDSAWTSKTSWQCSMLHAD